LQSDNFSDRPENLANNPAIFSVKWSFWMEKSTRNIYHRAKVEYMFVMSFFVRYNLRFESTRSEHCKYIVGK